MRKAMLLAGALVVPSWLSASPRAVAVELFTATWCTYCPYADSALDSLAAEYGSDYLQAIEVHVSSDGFDTPETNARASYYGVSGIPDAWFDGTIRYTGASSKIQAYNAYKQRIQNRLSFPSQLTVNVVPTYDGNNATITATYAVTTDIPGSETDLRVMAYVNENNCFYGGKYYNWVVRDIVPSQNGDPTTISTAGDTLVKVWNTTLSGSWKKADLYATVIIFSYATKHILQSAGAPFVSVGTEESPSEPLQLTLVAKGNSLLLTVPTAGEARLTLVDVAGRTVSTLVSGNLSSGKHSIAVPALKAGIYVARLSTFDGAVSVPFMSR